MRTFIEQGSQEWKELRKTKITGTDAAVIMGKNPWKNPLKLWQEKLGLTEEKSPSKIMLDGKQLESSAIALYSMITGIQTTEGVYISDERPWQMASLDGINDELVLEVKCGKKALEETKILDKVPEIYYPQCQHYMSVTGRDVCHFFCYYPDLGYKLIILKRDEEYIEELIKQEELFYQLISDKIPPGNIEDDYTILSTKEFRYAVEEWKSANNSLRYFQEQEKECRDKLISLTNNSNIMGFGLKMTFTNRTTIDYKKAISDNNIDIEKYKKLGKGFYKITEY